jgi:hypothetical protein
MHCELGTYHDERMEPILKTLVPKHASRLSVDVAKRSARMMINI